MLLDKAGKVIHLDVVGKGPYLWELTWKTQEVMVSFMCVHSSQQSHFRGNTHTSCKVGSSKEPEGSPTFPGILKVELILAQTAVFWLLAGGPCRGRRHLASSSRWGQDGLAPWKKDEGGARTSHLFSWEKQDGSASQWRETWKVVSKAAPSNNTLGGDAFLLAYIHLQEQCACKELQHW